MADIRTPQAAPRFTEYSCHHAHNIRNIPYSIGHTIHRIASERHEYEISKGQNNDFLKASGYSTEIIQKAFNKLETKNRMSYLEPNTKYFFILDFLAKFLPILKWCHFKPLFSSFPRS